MPWKKHPQSSRVVFTLSLAVLIARAVHADTFEWTNASDGVFSQATNWTRTSGAGPAPPGAGDTANFNEAGKYTVDFGGTATSDALTVSDGIVIFTSNNTLSRVYNVNTGAGVASVTGGSELSLNGTTGNMILNVGDLLTVSDGSAVSVSAGSDFSAVRLGLGTTGLNGVDNTLNVSGSGSTFILTTPGTTNIGFSGKTGILTLSSNARGTFTGVVELGDSASTTSHGEIQVKSDADLSAVGLKIGGGGNASAFGLLRVTDTGSTVTQSGASTLSIGEGASTGRLEIANSARFDTGTGGINVGPNGVIQIDGGTFDVDADVTITDGQLNLTSGTLDIAGGSTLRVNNLGRVDIDQSLSLNNLVVVVDGTASLNTATLDASGAGFLSVAQGTNLQVTNGGALVGSEINIGASGGDGVVLIGGNAASTYTANSTRIGLSGSFGQLAFLAGNTGDVGDLQVAVSNNDNSSGLFEVFGGSIDVESIRVATNGRSGQDGEIIVNGGTLQQTNNDNIVIGANTLNSSSASIQIINPGATLTTGTGTMTIHGSGDLTNQQGTINLNGNLVVDGGTYLEDTLPGTVTNFAPGISVTVQNDGRIDLNAPRINVGEDQTLTLNGDGSEMRINGISAPQIVIGDDGGTTSTLNLRNANQLAVSSLTMKAGQTGGGVVVDAANAVLNIQSGARLLTQSSDRIGFALIGGSVVVNVDGADSTWANFHQGSPTDSFIGNNVTGGTTATINLTTGGLYHFDNRLTLNASGEILLNNGRMIASNDLIVDGGRILQTSDNSNGFGLVDQLFETTVHVVRGGSIDLVQPSLQLGNTRIRIDGPGSRFTTTGAVIVSADDLKTGGFFLSNFAQAQLGEARMGRFTYLGDNRIEISSGATLTTDDIHVGDISDLFTQGATNATVVIDGAGSLFRVRAGQRFILGAPQNTSVPPQHATLHLVDGGTLDTTAGTLEINPSAIINLDGGRLNAGVINHNPEPFNQPQINFNTGSISFTGNLTLDHLNLLGPTLELGSDKHLSLTGVTTVSPNGSLTIDGGSLSAGALVNNGQFDFNSGQLTLTGMGLTIGDGGLLGAALILPAVQGVRTPGHSIIVAPEGLMRFEGGSIQALSLINNGQIVYGGGEVDILNLFDVTPTGRLLIAPNRSLNTDASLRNFGQVELLGARIGQGPGQAGAVTNAGLLTGDGRIDLDFVNRVAGEIRVTSGHTLAFANPTGPNDGLINLIGGTAQFDDALVNTAGGRIAGRGTLAANGGLTNRGRVLFSAGLTDVFGEVANAGAGQFIVTGHGTATFYDDFDHNGAEVRVSTGSSAVFFGDVTGAGPYKGSGDVFFEGAVFPGNSPATVDFGGNLSFGPSSTLAVELGGTDAGSEYDQINVAGDLNLSGDLDLRLIDDYGPLPLDAFRIATFDTLTGDFDEILGQQLDSGLLLIPVVSANAYDLVTAIPADFDLNGQVDVADLSIWATGFGNTDSFFQNGDADLNGQVDVADLSIWATRFGSTAADFLPLLSPPVLAALNSATAIPEPSSLMLIGLSVIGLKRPRRFPQAA